MRPKFNMPMVKAKPIAQQRAEFRDKLDAAPLAEIARAEEALRILRAAVESFQDNYQVRMLTRGFVQHDAWIIERTRLEDNARFIAAARTDVPALCDEVEELRAQVEHMRPVCEAADRWVDVNDDVAPHTDEDADRLTNAVQAWREKSR